jgi:general secretion pathway protein F
MTDFSASFSPLYRALISAGEAIGNLELPLSRLTTLLTYQQKMRKQLFAALTYPLFLMALMLLAVAVLIGFVVPSLEPLFEGRELPWFTSLIFQISHFIRHYWHVLSVFTMGSGGLLFYLMRKKSTQITMQRLLLKTPAVGNYIRHSCLARFARTLATLTEGGLPLTTSLSYATEALHNVRLEEIFHQVSLRVIEGKAISYELMRYVEIPPLFSRMIKIGEESGKLSPMLVQIANMYDDETERTLNRLVTLAQPILLIIMGACIGAVILSILLPLSDFGAGIQL